MSWLRSSVQSALLLLLTCSTAIAGRGDAADAPAPAADELRVGHWVTVKGRYTGRSELVAEEVEVVEPADEEVLIGEVRRVIPDRGRFVLLGQTIHTDDETEYGGDLSLRLLRGRRVKVEGEHDGPRKFSAEEVSPRERGRDQVEGRVDFVRRVAGELELYVMHLKVRVPADVEIESEQPLDELALAPLRHEVVPPEQRIFRDDDDAIPGTIRITEDLSLGALLELELRREEDFDLNASRERDRTDRQLSGRFELRWSPVATFDALARARFSRLDRIETGDEDEIRDDASISELWGLWRDIGGSGIDLHVGRQDFDEPREWLYDQNLDAVRAYYTRPSLRVELSASTVLDDGSPRDESTENYILYVSNNDFDRHLAAYVVDRRDYRADDDLPLHFGGRVLGEWLPDSDVWLEAAMLRGYSDDVNLEGWAVDAGATWSPDVLEPFNVTAGWAYGSGDDPATSDTDESFRQTGLHDNNGKFAGVTSFRYYGELLDPELSNLSILTLGLGVRPSRDVSLDLVGHVYSQVEAAPFLLDAEVSKKPDGVHRDLGWEVDLVLGFRGWGNVDVELIAARFEPGDAFPEDADEAWLGAFQIRYRF